MSARKIPFLSILIAVILVFGNVTDLSAQKGKKNKDKGGGTPVFKGKPEKILKEADALYAGRQFSIAEIAYRAVLDKEPDNFHATLRAAKCNRIIQEYEEAIKWYESAINLNAKANDTALFELGLCYKMVERYNDAREVFQQFQKIYPLRDEYARRVKLEIQGCDFAMEEAKKDPEYVLKPVNFNSSSGDMFPIILNQNGVDSFVVFTSHRSESQGNESYSGLGEAAFTDLWMAKMEDDSTFGPPENLGKKVNTKHNDGSASFSPDRTTMYYSICNSGKLGYGCSIYESKYDPSKKAWGKAKLTPGINGFRELVVNSRGKTKKVPTWDAQPALSTDGTVMFFVSDREGGWGSGLDIWYSEFDGEEWGEPINAGPNINTAFDDLSPRLSKDGSKLFFSSDGRVGMGGLDLFQSEGSIGNWGEPLNMGIPINSSFDDFGPYWAKEDSILMFTSNRRDGQGRDDIYYAKRNPKPDIVVTIHGVIRDKKTKQPVPFAEAVLYEKDFEGDLIPIDTFRTAQNAEYNFNLEPDKEYKIIANAPEYLANEEEFDTRGLEEDTDLERNIDIFLERIEINLPIVLNNIYYDFDKYDLRVESVNELTNLMKILDQNKNISIQIGSHTDSNGSEPYNKTLSENRAKAVVSFLIENGVNPDRLAWYGFGESQLLIYPELSDQDEQINRRSEFRIKSINFQPK